MRFQIECCDLCHAPLKGEKHGAMITCGQSRGGWGHRETPVDWSGEVCPKCYDEYTKITAAILGWLDKRNGQRAPNIIVRENDLSVVQEDEPSPRGRATPLLR